MKSGIYQIICLANGKVYIGSAINFESRWQKHIHALKGQYHENKYLQRAWNKYGENYFEFNIIEECEIEILIKREQYYLDYFESYKSENGYNLSPTAGSVLGFKHSEETKIRMSQERYGKKAKKKEKYPISTERKFSDDIIREIRANKKNTHRELAEMYGAGKSTIGYIRNRDTYKNVKSFKEPKMKEFNMSQQDDPGIGQNVSVSKGQVYKVMDACTGQLITTSGRLNVTTLEDTINQVIIGFSGRTSDYTFVDDCMIVAILHPDDSFGFEGPG